MEKLFWVLCKAFQISISSNLAIMCFTALADGVKGEHLKGDLSAGSRTKLKSPPTIVQGRGSLKCKL